MYRFSRSIYRELAPRIEAEDVTAMRDGADTGSWRPARRRCAGWPTTAAISRAPRATLFSEIRDHFPLTEQVHVYMVIERYIDLAPSTSSSCPTSVGLDGQPRACRASTRKGTPASASRCRAATTAPRTSTSRSRWKSKSSA